MTPHLPYACDEDDEFFHPVEGWLLLDRAVAYDSWITWRHALPSERDGRNALTPEISLAIHALADALHEIHRRLPGYDELGESPLVVPRWWDPEAEDEWNTGRCCLFRIEGFRSGDLIHHWNQEAGIVALTVASAHHVEAVLLIDPASDPWASQSSGRGGRRRSPASRRRSQSPPPETPVPNRPVPLPVRC